MYQFSKVPKIHPTLLVFITKKNSECNWISVTISSGTITGIQSILSKVHAACICLECLLEKRYMAFCTPDVENKIPLKNFSGTAPNLGSPSPPSSNTSLFFNYQVETNFIFSAFIINLPSALFLHMWSDSTTRSNIHRTCCRYFIRTFT